MVKIIADSGCDLTLEQAEKMDVAIVPLHVEIDGKMMQDRAKLEPDDLYEYLERCEQLPKTSQPAPAAFLTVYEQFPDDELLVLPIAKELSGTYQSAHLAAQLSGRSDIYIADTKQATLTLRMLIEEAVRLRDEGRKAEEIMKQIESIRDQFKVIAVVDTLEYLYKGGRLSKTAALAGNVMKIKPLIGIGHGRVMVLSKARGKKAVLREVLALMEKDEVDPCRVVFGYTGKQADADLESFMEGIGERYAFSSAETAQIGAAIGVHAGPGAKAVVYRIKEIDK